MAIQLSTTVRNARLDAIETTIGASAVLKIRTGAAPANVATADSGTVLATLSLPSDWSTGAGHWTVQPPKASVRRGAARSAILAAASGGAKALAGTWQDASADATGTAAHWRLYASDGTTAHMQGTVTATGGGGDMTVDSTSFTAAQSFSVTSFTLTDGNA